MRGSGAQQHTGFPGNRTQPLKSLEAIGDAGRPVTRDSSGMFVLSAAWGRGLG